MPAYPVTIDFENPPKQGYAQTMIRMLQSDKDLVDKAAALCEMDRAPYYRAILLRVSLQVIKQHEEISAGRVAPPSVRQTRAQHRKLRTHRQRDKR